MLTALLFVFLSPLTIVQSQPRRLSSADILRVATVSDAQISPSGEWIVERQNPTAQNSDQAIPAPPKKSGLRGALSSVKSRLG